MPEKHGDTLVDMKEAMDQLPRAFIPSAHTQDLAEKSRLLTQAVQAHQQEDLQTATRLYRAFLDQAPDDAQGLTFLAMAQAAAGNLDRAEALLGQALRNNPLISDSYIALGDIHFIRNQVAEARKPYLTALALGHSLANSRLQKIYKADDSQTILSDQRLVAETELAIGKPLEAFNRVRALLQKQNKDAKTWAVFTRCAIPLRFRETADKTVINDLLSALNHDGLNHQFLVTPVLSALQHEAEMSPLLSTAENHVSLCTQLKQRLLDGSLEALANHSLFLALLERTIINDIGFEKRLTALRHILLDSLFTNAEQVSSVHDSYLPLAASLAQQCYLNEYIYPVSKLEVSTLTRLEAAIRESIENGSSTPPHWIILLAAYRPLAGLGIAEELAALRWPKWMESLIRTQISEPLEEQKLWHSIPSMTSIHDEVSLQTREEYEGHPFPKWPSLPIHEQPRPLVDYLRAHLPDQALSDQAIAKQPRILVAGCGTGLDACFLARHVKHSMVTGMDLSRASLAYAARKSCENHLENIRFMHGDILQLPQTEALYDHINCFGVLQLLEDTESGIGILRDRLAPGGIMLIALYSSIGRQAVDWARNHIASRGYRARNDEMRTCRQDLVEMATDNNFAHQIVDSLAFYNMSNFRDLVFHSTEKTFTLLEISAMFDRLGLEFLGFELEPATRAEYRRRYPRDVCMTSLTNWHQFEQAFPTTFANCHAFWLRRQS